MSGTVGQASPPAGSRGLQPRVRVRSSRPSRSLRQDAPKTGSLEACPTARATHPFTPWATPLWTREQSTRWRKGDKRKVRIALRLGRETTMTLKWIAEQLAMGTWANVARRLYEAKP